jgi:hypothetical protein
MSTVPCQGLVVFFNTGLEDCRTWGWGEGITGMRLSPATAPLNSRPSGGLTDSALLVLTNASSVRWSFRSIYMIRNIIMIIRSVNPGSFQWRDTTDRCQKPDSRGSGNVCMSRLSDSLTAGGAIMVFRASRPWSNVWRSVLLLSS